MSDTDVPLQDRVNLVFGMFMVISPEYYQRLVANIAEEYNVPEEEVREAVKKMPPMDPEDF